MSYSRWSDSRWYTFHNSASGDTLESQIFSIYDSKGPSLILSYKDLVSIDRNGLLKMLGDAPAPDADELEELFGYVTEWLVDMREAFNG